MAGQWGGVLGMQNGIVVAPMGPDLTGPDLVAAVANAGGLGLLRAPSLVRLQLATSVPNHISSPPTFITHSLWPIYWGFEFKAKN